MKRFTDEENARVDFLIEEIKLLTVLSTPIITEYQNELLEYVIQNHPKANDFYYYGE